MFLAGQPRRQRPEPRDFERFSLPRFYYQNSPQDYNRQPCQSKRKPRE